MLVACESVSLPCGFQTLCLPTLEEAVITGENNANGMVWESLLFLVLPATILYHTVTSDQDGETTRRHEYDLQPPHIGHSVSLGGKLTLEQRPGRGLTEMLDTGHFESLDVTVTSDQHPDHELTKSLDSGRLGSPGGILITEQHHHHELNKSLDSGYLGSLDGTPIPEQHHHHELNKSLDSGYLGSLNGTPILEQHHHHELNKSLDSGYLGSLNGTPILGQHHHHELNKSLDGGHLGSLVGTPIPEQHRHHDLTKYLDSNQFGSLDDILIPDQHFYHELTKVLDSGHFKSLDGILTPEKYTDKGSTKSLRSSPEQILDEHFEDESNTRQVKGLPTQATDHCNVLIDGNKVSCFRPEDGHYDKKLEQLQYHYPALSRVSTGTSRCSTLQYYTRRRITLGSLFIPCVETSFILRTPFFMYNTDQQLRYILQDPPHIQQCYFDAHCRFANRICFRFNTYLLMSKCHLRTCVHTLLAWNPSAPQLGTFFDTFHFACYCECPGHFYKG